MRFGSSSFARYRLKQRVLVANPFALTQVFRIHLSLSLSPPLRQHPHHTSQGHTTFSFPLLGGRPFQGLFSLFFKMYRRSRYVLCSAQGGGWQGSSSSSSSSSPAVGTIWSREEAGTTLVSSVKEATDVQRAKKRSPYRASKEEKLEAGLVMKEKRAALLEQGREIPEELKPLAQRSFEKKLRRFEDTTPGAVQQLKLLHRERPELRQFSVRNRFCTSLHNNASTLHPLAQSRWWDILKSTPQGLLRFHLRELVPVLEDRMKDSKFHEFFESSDMDVLKRKGYVFEGRDGEPLKVTKEELRALRKAKLHKKLDPRTKSRMSYLIDRRLQVKSKLLAASPTYRPLVYSDGDTIAYFGYRTFPIYAVMLRVYAEIAMRCPGFAPRSLLDFGAGTGTSIWCAIEVWKGIAHHRPDDETLSEKLHAEKHFKRFNDEYLTHPMVSTQKVKGFIKEILEGQNKALTKQCADVKQKVNLGLLPSGSDVEMEDMLEENNRILDKDVWASTEAWKTHESSETDTGLDEDFMGEGMYSEDARKAGTTKKFEETDYFMEHDHSEYPKPPEIEQLEERGLRADFYLKWFNVRAEWAHKYYKHVEKQKMERDPTYRPYSALQYLKGQSATASDDDGLPSEQLHHDADEKAICYGNWEKREAEILQRIVAIEPSAGMRTYGEDFLLDVAPHVLWKRFLRESTDSNEAPTDLVTSAYTLSELPSESLRADAIRALWEKCGGILVIVEAGTPAGFKLVLDARTTILDEYKDIGPWEDQPTVLAPCPHDEIRCPLAHSLAGKRKKGFRTCHASAKYSPSHVEKWVAGGGKFDTQHVEEYSYCIIAKNIVIPEKALQKQKVPKYTPTVLSGDAEQMKHDPRLKALKDRNEAHGTGLNRIQIPSRKIKYPVDKVLGFPQTEENLNPFVGRWASYGKPATAKDLVSLHKEKETYKNEFRRQSWLWNRVVRTPRVSHNGTDVYVDICTPHGTLEAARIRKNDKITHLSKMQDTVEAGSLFPNHPNMDREEYIQGDTTNTFSNPGFVDPLQQKELAESAAEEEREQEQELEAEMDPEEVRVKQAAEQRQMRAAEGDVASLKEMRDEVNNANLD